MEREASHSQARGKKYRPVSTDSYLGGLPPKLRDSAPSQSAPGRPRPHRYIQIVCFLPHFYRARWTIELARRARRLLPSVMSAVRTGRRTRITSICISGVRTVRFVLDFHDAIRQDAGLLRSPLPTAHHQRRPAALPTLYCRAPGAGRRFLRFRNERREGHDMIAASETRRTRAVSDDRHRNRTRSARVAQ
jgi:hypothetical protein